MYPVRLFRQARNLTQAQLGKLVGRSRSAIAAWEAGTVQPDVAATRLMESLRDKKPEELRGLIDGRDPAPDLPHSAERFLDYIKKGARPRIDLGDEKRAMRITPQGGASEKFDLEGLRALSTVDNPELVGHVDYPTESPLQLPTGLGRLGARYISTDKPLGEIMIPALDSDPAVFWLDEGEAHPGTGDATTSQTTPSWRTASALVNVTRKLRALSVPDGAAAVSAAILRALGRALDTVALVGDNVKQPEGLLSVGGTQALDALGSFTGATFDEAMKLLAAAGVDASAVSGVANETVRETLSGVAYDGGNLWSYRGGENLAGGLRAMVSSAMPAGTLALGDFSRIAAIHKSEVDTVTVAQPNDSSRIFNFLECATQVKRPNAFVLVSNI